MYNDRGFGFIGGFVLGGIVGAAVALLMAPASGAATREQIRAEGIELRNRGQQFGDDSMQQAQKMVKQGQKGVADTQARIGSAIEEHKNNLLDAIDAGKHAAAQRKGELKDRFEAAKDSRS
ncbi:MAG TPA: YtxH domain-containing protein [Anaerolineae bacterium]|nr:YtxH domain-containing protein [Anaerolineae bacterium]